MLTKVYIFYDLPNELLSFDSRFVRLHELENLSLHLQAILVFLLNFLRLSNFHEQMHLFNLRFQFQNR
jgi:hypothetical protein